MSTERTVFQIQTIVGGINTEVLRRNNDDAYPTLLIATFDLNINEGFTQRSDPHILLFNLYVRIGYEHLQFHLIQILILLSILLCILLPEVFHDTILQEEGILEPVIQDHEAIIVLVEDMIEIVSFLLRILFILRSNRIKHQSFITG